MGKIKNLCPEVLAVLDSSPINASPSWYFMVLGFSGDVLLVWSAKLFLRSSFQAELNLHKHFLSLFHSEEHSVMLFLAS